ncbi:MAG: hypothetical protein KC618_05225 [Candidatus Omnitrophica bacterium]|nr:hypothetical protein [Candidatus Omnitrophota bacterium]
MKKGLFILTAIVVLSGSLSWAAGETKARGLYADGRQSDKSFQLFKWKVTVQDQKGKDEVIDTPAELDAYINRTDNEVIVKARERMQWELERLEHRRQEKIERAEYLKKADIQKAERDAEKRIQRANEDKEEAAVQLRERLWDAALEELKNQGYAVEEIRHGK